MGTRETHDRAQIIAMQEAVDNILAQHAAVMREELTRFQGPERGALLDLLFQPMLVRERFLRVRPRQYIEKDNTSGSPSSGV